ncbi:MAG: hypothetical protein WAO56_05780 [Miniphocaeibacter sp.]|uniref:hypothetical protein n=1 Tax=Miniphocaeibacter sp. TaxID=3100973 RepID=UPI0017BE74AF|nr:DUF1637 domain-containing protein [Gallicola sp.]
MLGIIKNEIGPIFKGKNYKVVKKLAGRGDNIPAHNHLGEDVVFSLIKGNVIVRLNEKEDYNLKQGDVLNFNGENTISVDFIEDSEIVIVLVENK